MAVVTQSKDEAYAEDVAAYLEAMPLEDLAEMGAGLKKERNNAAAAYARVEYELSKRMRLNNAKRLVLDKWMVDADFPKAHKWDVKCLLEIPAARPYLEEVPEQIIPATFKVRNTTALLNFIDSLGESDLAIALRQCHRVEEGAAKLSFDRILGEGE